MLQESQKGGCPCLTNISVQLRSLRCGGSRGPGIFEQGVVGNRMNWREISMRDPVGPGRPANVVRNRA